ncbi:hypothetical protein SAMN05720761_11025 [Fibrobacter sp. UWCM]|uniref:hypothetical protein n=1 Tax=Fibrobacter sp. UWCM TaxID=1896208 RepID=UPI0009134AB1|nr:hypothetical protein [Fibrobacter sp. UWCM]SHH18057.1 hypothetical protein SAMN05720761_11025 [Fibrobacter sp. UWCM]
MNFLVNAGFARRVAGVVAVASSLALAATETLFSNWAFSVAPGGDYGSLWVFSRGDMNSGVTRLDLKVSASGQVQVSGTEQGPLSDSVTAVHDGIFTDVNANHRRIPAENAGRLGLVYPMYGLDNNGNLLQPEGIISVRSTEDIFETPLELPSAAEELDSAMTYAVSGLAYDSTRKTLWIARGMLGLTGYDISRGANDPKEFRLIFDRENKTLDTLKLNASKDLKKYTEVFDVALDPNTRDLWMATARGLWVLSADGKLASASKVLDSMRVTGVWVGGDPLMVIAETQAQGKESMKGGLWRKYVEKSGDFAKVPFIDVKGNSQKKDVYDNADYTVSNVAFVGKQALVAVRTVGGSVTGLLRVDSLGVRAYESDEEESQWLFGFEMGVTDRDVMICDIAAFPLEKNTTGLAVATYGNGISVSADTGRTWTPILNRAKLSGNLGTVRMVPSVITAGSESLVSYKVSKDSKITIEVFSYDMKKVRKIVKSAPRFADASRSTNAKEDVWDGLDDYGNPCAMGVYYVRVKDNHGHVGWGKVMTLGGTR